MRTALALLIAASIVVSPCAEARGQRQPASVAGKFDYYVLSLSWSPAYCESHAEDRQQCGAERLGFVLHGLWPQYASGSYPQTCAVREQVDEATHDFAKTVFPSEKLIAHEWLKHGTCSGMGPRAYFEAADKARKSVAIPADLQPGSRTRTSTAATISRSIRDANPGLTNRGVAILCAQGELSEVRVCLNRDLEPMACGSGVRTACGSAVKIPGVQ